MKTTNHFIAISLFCFLLSFSGCNSKEKPIENDSLQIISIDPQDEEKKTLSQIADTIIFIPLETKPNALIGRISKMRIYGSKIYILDKSVGECLFVFDITGTFLFKINKTGKGPGEFIKFSGFCVTEKDEIVVSDFSGKKILFYNKEGIFIKEEVYTDFYPSDIAYLGEDVFAITSYQPSKRIIIMRRNGEIIRKAFDSYPGLFRYYNNELITGTERVFFREVFADTIFRIGRNNIAPEFFINFHDKRMLRSYYMSLPLTEKRGISTRIIPSGYRYGCFSMVETSKYLSFNFLETPAKGNQYWCIYDKLKGESSYMKVGVEFDDLFGIIFSPRIKAADDDKFYYSIDSYTFLENSDNTMQRFNMRKPGYLPQLEAINSSISIDSNPIIVAFSIL